MLRRVLIANRGEIACRIQQTLDRLAVESVAVYSDADSGARNVRLATEARHLGPAPVAESYLLAERLLEIARETRCDAIHPGYGLLSEHAGFARASEAAGLSFLGPTPIQIANFGLKHRARLLAEKAGLPLLPGSDVVASLAEARAHAKVIGYPVLLKASSGGGGIGMARCDDAESLAAAWESVRRLGTAHFGDADVFLEKLVPRARHIEVQVFGDGTGRTVSLGTRDCSLQRRRQKLFEEAPAPHLSEHLEARLLDAATTLANSVEYRSAGTVEFLVDAETEAFFFLEVNARLQVEHPVTEAIFGIDLVEWMLRLGSGETAFLDDWEPRPQGHAIEVRLVAEDASRDFQPGTGTLVDVHWPSRVRVDTWVQPGTEVTPYYDPLLAKIIVHRGDRALALSDLEDALAEARLGGLPTNLNHAHAVTRWPVFREARHHTTSLDEFSFEASDVQVLEARGLTTVHDFPARVGAWGVGVPPSGPMDPLALQLANRIVGNAAGLPALEIAVHGPRLLFSRDAWVALAGAAIDAKLGETSVTSGRAFLVAGGSELCLGAISGPGARAYLAIRGGLCVPEVLGSASTFLLGGFGGVDGRPLQPGDVLAWGDCRDAERCPDDPLATTADETFRVPMTDDWQIGVLDGPHTSPEFLTEPGIEQFYETIFQVHYQSDRTGVRLIGPKPLWTRPDGGEAGLHPSNLHDTAYSVGAIDYTGDMPVILGPDGPSLGGFVCPAVVASSELWKLGQLSAGDRVRFRALEPDEALSLQSAQTRWIETRGSEGGGLAELPERAGPSSITEGILARKLAAPKHPAMTIRQSGDQAVLVEFGPMVLDLDLRIRIQLLLHALEARIEREELAGILDLTPGIRSLQVHFDPGSIQRDALIRILEETVDALPDDDDLSLPTRIVHLPLSWDDPATREAIAKYQAVVRDDAPWCPSNIEFIRRINGLETTEDVKRIVFDATYLVMGLGDVYLGAPVATPLDPRHRLVTTKYNPARTWTPENAVGIGGAYLCIYGMEGPGGYQFVGRTLPIWSTFGRANGTSREVPWLLRHFDQIRFYPVSHDELQTLRQGMRDGRVEVAIEAGRFDVGAHRRFLKSIDAETQKFRSNQQAAFAEERGRWEESGEFEAAGHATARQTAAPTAAGEPTLPPGATRIDSPLGAMIFRVSVELDALVTTGDELVVLSAMKTETPVLAPCDGRVHEILCTQGQVVGSGAPLVVL